MKLMQAMFHKDVVRRMIMTTLKVLGIVGLYFAGLVWVFSTQTLTGNQNIGEITITILLLFLSMYGVFIFLPYYIFIKSTYEVAFYLRPLAHAYGRRLSPMKKKLVSKEKFKIAFILFIAAIFAFIVISLTIKKAPFLIIIGFIPFYILIYKNWIKGLHLTLGKKFKKYYRRDRKAYMIRAFGWMLLMHIPIFWFLQPWVLQSLADIYFQALDRDDFTA